MEYNCQNFKDGSVLTAACLNHIEQGVQNVCNTLDCVCGEGQPEKLSEYVQNVVETSTPKEVANALKGNASGEIVAFDDVSPIKHEMSVNVRNKNLWSKEDNRLGTQRIISKMFKVKPYTDYVITAETYTVKAPLFSIRGYDEYVEDAPVGLIFGSTGNGASLGVKNCFNTGQYKYIGIRTLESNETYGIDENTNFQLEEGSTATAYVPHIDDISNVNVLAQGKNLWDAAKHIRVLNNRIVTDYFKVKKNTVYTVSVDGRTDVKWTVKGYTEEQTADNSTPYVWSNGKSFSYGGSGVINQFNSGDFEYIAMRMWGDFETYGVTVDSHYQLEVGTTATAYEPYIEPVTYPVGADGVVQGVTPIYPNTTLLTDTAGAVMDVTYNRDANKVVNELATRIAALEAAVLN